MAIGSAKAAAHPTGNTSTATSGFEMSRHRFTVAENANDTDIENALQAGFKNGTMSAFSSGTGSVSDGWRLRPFHPNIDGHSH